MQRNILELAWVRGDNIINLFPAELDDKEITFPFFDQVCAGFPSPAADYEQKPLDPRDYLIKNQSSTFFARVKGSSMVDAGIFENDVIVVDRSINPKVGDIILAVINAEFTVKYLGKNEHGALLIPANKDFQTIEVKDNPSFSVWGVVTGSMRKF